MCVIRDMNPTDEDIRSDGRSKHSFSLREYIGAVTIAMVVVGLIATGMRLRRADTELARLHAQLGYLSETDPGQIAAARAPSDQPLSYRVRLRVPAKLKYRVTYSSMLPKDSIDPDWYGAVPVPQGESTLTVRIHQDPRDHRWKILASIVGEQGTRRMATVLPEDQTEIFRGSHDVVATGIGTETLAAGGDDSIRLLDERWLVGEAGLLLYGDSPPEQDQIGIYAELQPDNGPL
jgi:hypothetical protein